MDRVIELDALEMAGPSRPVIAPEPGVTAPPRAATSDAVHRVARQVRSGTYHPRPDDVAEVVLAWLFPSVRSS